MQENKKRCWGEEAVAALGFAGAECSCCGVSGISWLLHLQLLMGVFSPKITGVKLSGSFCSGEGSVTPRSAFLNRAKIPWG